MRRRSKGPAGTSDTRQSGRQLVQDDGRYVAHDREHRDENDLYGREGHLPGGEAPMTETATTILGVRLSRPTALHGLVVGDCYLVANS